MKIYKITDGFYFGVFSNSNPKDPCPQGWTRLPPPNIAGTEVAQWLGDRWVLLPARPLPTVPPLTDRQHAKWQNIKAERDRRKYIGVKVADHWFHSDDPSRIQQLALAMMGDSIPAGLQWKTLTKEDTAVFVEMTPTLAAGIFQATAASDAAIFAAAEAHRLTMESSESPENYNFSTGWPASIEDAQ